jgi:hypothetical protein
MDRAVAYGLKYATGFKDPTSAASDERDVNVARSALGAP